jgi:hypothetical protein
MTLLIVKITPDPIVLEKLSAAFPSPANGAKRILDKYLKVLEEEIAYGMVHGHTAFFLKSKAFEIRLAVLTNKGGEINRKNQARIRTHAWLQKNGVPLVEIYFYKGSNLNGKNSSCMLTSLVNITFFNHLTNSQTPSFDLATYLNNPTADDRARVGECFDAVLAAPRTECDISPINVDAVKQRLEDIVSGIGNLRGNKKYRFYDQALMICRVGQFMNGELLQVRKPSVFGRTYYTGWNAQNVHKLLRNAMLSHAYEYDIKSAAINWRLSEFLKIPRRAKPRGPLALPNEADLRQLFPITHDYLKQKKSFYDRVIQQTFRPDSEISLDEQHKLIKKAFTAVNFGAKISSGAWKNESGEYVHSEIYDLFDDNGERLRFFACSDVKEFAMEQGKIDKVIIDSLKAKQSPVFSLECVKNSGGNFAKNKVMSYLYQHAETEMMDIVRAELIAINNPPIANIHDAIVVRHQLTSSQLSNIERKVQLELKHPFFKLGETAL